MTNYMLMNGAVTPDAEHEEFRVAILKDSKLYNFFVDLIGHEQKKSNIYKGILTRVEPSLEAVFVDYGAEKHGFLPFKEIADVFLKPLPENTNYVSMKDRLTVGQELMIQIDKDERGSKGAALTTFISLAGSYLVLMPNNPKAGGISRRIEGESRENIKETLTALDVPDDMGLIVRTAGVGKNQDELKWDLSILIKHWQAIQEAYQSRPGSFLIHQESNIIVRAIRDYMREDIDEILVDNPDVFNKAQEYIQQVRPDFLHKVKLYQSHVPLFSRFQIESQIEAAFHHEVRLPSGGVIVIDHTEALVSIDVNSSRSTRGGDIEETALSTNLEAADEIARQVRLRDTGGLIVIDFIDMHSNKHQREVEERLRIALEVDRARVQIGRISRFGLLEMSRQRVRTSLGEATEITCPRCSGYGSVRTITSLTLSILRLIEEEALKENTRAVHAHLPVDLATYLLNEKRDSVTSIEKRHGTRIWIIPSPYLTSPHYKIERVRETDHRSSSKSYEVMGTSQSRTDTQPGYDKKEKRLTEEPAVKSSTILQPHPTAPSAMENRSKGLFTRLIGSLFGDKNEKPESESAHLPETSKEISPKLTTPQTSTTRGIYNNNKPQKKPKHKNRYRDNKEYPDNRHKPRQDHQKKDRIKDSDSSPVQNQTKSDVSIEVKNQLLTQPTEQQVEHVPTTPVTPTQPTEQKQTQTSPEVSIPETSTATSENASSQNNPNYPSRPLYGHKRRGRHLRRGASSNHRHKNDAPDEKS